jgi:hypothetical protein
VDERASASSAFEIEVVSTNRARGAVTSLMSLLAFTSGSATLPQVAIGQVAAHGSFCTRRGRTMLAWAGDRLAGSDAS